jgi:putative transposase
MARAHRHYIPGHAWHITHRCHKRDFLLKFARDRHRFLQWLFEAKKRYGLVILSYMVTSNHIHLLVYDNGSDAVIPKSIQLIAGRTAQEYNQRKIRKGAFWEDRYHATIIQSGEHLLRCIIYIDMNMVRAGVVEQPGQWPHSGFNEIRNPRRKCILIDYDMLSRLSGFDDFERFQAAHLKWVCTASQEDGLRRESQWTQSIAVGNESFVTTIKKQMRSLAVGRRARLVPEGCELREPKAVYNGDFVAEKGDIGLKNVHLWDLSNVITDR